VSLLIAVHAAAATFALMLGAVVIRHRPRGDRVHRRLGAIWFASMYFVVLSSFGIKRLTPGHFSWIHGLSIFTFVTLSLALYGQRTGNVKLHRGNAVGSYFGLVGAGISASAFPVRAIPQLAIHRPFVLAAAVLAIAGAVAAVTSVVTKRRKSVTSRRSGRYVRWGPTRGALSSAYDDYSSGGRFGRNADVVPDDRRSSGSGGSAQPDRALADDVGLGVAAR
jgi:uncharacterized membrane protein